MFAHLDYIEHIDQLKFLASFGLSFAVDLKKKMLRMRLLSLKRLKNLKDLWIWNL